MREILFRGKRVDNGEWIYGFFINDSYGIRKFIKPNIIIGDIGEASFNGNGDYISYEVIPETVGQYTGEKDKNGKKIFEGDVVEVPNWDFAGMVEYAIPECRYEIAMLDGDYVMMHDFASDVEIIGNIHDNPELLEV